MVERPLHANVCSESGHDLTEFALDRVGCASIDRASVGPKAGVATENLAAALEDPIPGVRWAAGEALASIGPKAQAAHEALREAASDPALRDEAEWALNRIAGGVESREPVGVPVAPVPSVAPQPEKTVAQTGNPPVDWDTSTGRNIVWSVELGHPTYGRPVVAGDAVYVGTDNARRMDPDFQEEREVWGCVLLAGDRLYVGSVDGNVTALRAGRRREVLAQIQMDAALFASGADRRCAVSRHRAGCTSSRQSRRDSDRMAD